MYKEYLEEHQPGKSLYFNDFGYATYVIIGEECYIDTVYVLKDFRNQKRASELADEIVKIAKKNGCKYLTGTVFTDQDSLDKQTISAKGMFGYGFKLSKAYENKIVFVKGI